MIIETLTIPLHHGLILGRADGQSQSHVNVWDSLLGHELLRYARATIGIEDAHYLAGICAWGTQYSVPLLSGRPVAYKGSQHPILKSYPEKRDKVLFAQGLLPLIVFCP